MIKKSMPKKVIFVENIENKALLDKIDEVSKLVEKFRVSINESLSRKLEEPQFFIVTSSEPVIGSKCQVVKYEMYWCMPYIDLTQTVDIYKLAITQRYSWPKKVLFFKFTVTEIEEHVKLDLRSFKLFLTDEKDTFYNSIESKVSEYSEKDMELVLVDESIKYCVDKINVVFDRMIQKQNRIEEFWEDFDISA